MNGAPTRSSIYLASCPSVKAAVWEAVGSVRLYSIRLCFVMAAICRAEGSVRCYYIRFCFPVGSVVVWWGLGVGGSNAFDSVRFCSIRLGSAQGGEGTKDSSATSVFSKRFFVETSVESISFLPRSRDLTVLFFCRGPHTPIVLHKQKSCRAARHTRFRRDACVGCFFEEISLQKLFFLSCVGFFRWIFSRRPVCTLISHGL